MNNPTEILPQSLADLLRNPQYSMETRALLVGDIRRFKGEAIQPNYWTFDYQGDEILVDEDKLSVITPALSRSAGTQVRLSIGVAPNAELEQVLTVDATSREALIRELLAYVVEGDDTLAAYQCRKDLEALSAAVTETATKAGIPVRETPSLPHLLQLLQELAATLASK